MLACAQFVCAQDRNYTAVNPLLFSYTDSDVYVQPPQKHNNGRQIMSPDSFKYPWENHLDNGMPNALEGRGKTEIGSRRQCRRCFAVF